MNVQDVQQPRRLLVVTSTLATGGAEMMLCKLLRELPRERFHAAVIALGPTGRPAELLRESEIEVVECHLPRFKGIVLAPFVACRFMRNFKPDLVQGWMYHGNLAAQLLCATASWRPKLFWSVRQSLYDLHLEKPMTRRVIRLNARFSNRTHRIVYVSDVSRSQHEAIGFAAQRGCVIPNGFDTRIFTRDETKRALLRAEWGISADRVIVGHLARFHPQKDQPTLLQAAREVAAKRQNVQFVLAGPGLDPSNTRLTKLLTDLGVSGHVRLLGETGDPIAFLSACDVFCLSSIAEGFPNALGEAMATELPAVVTRVGECPELVDGCGIVVDPGTPAALAGALIDLIDAGATGRQRLGRMARERIVSKYSLSSVAARYEEIYQAAPTASSGQAVQDRV